MENKGKKDKIVDHGKTYISAKYIIVPVMLLFLVACGPKIPNILAPVESPQRFSYRGSEAVPDRWWTAFEDPRLNLLVDSALANNLDLAAIWQRFKAAEAVAKREGADLWPQLEASAQSAMSRPQPDFAGGENVQLGISASYEFDVWGRIRTAVQAEKFRATASLADYRTAAISLSSEIALTWYRMVAAKKQLALAEEQIRTNQNIIKSIRARFGSGQVRAVDILRQLQLLESTKDQKIVFETNVSLFENQLAVLLGKSPGAVSQFSETNFPQLTALPETGLPLELVRRRPDVQRAYDLLLAADMDMASAVKNKYPRLSIRLSGQLRANDFNTLFQNWAYSLAGNLIAPLFYGGRLGAEVDRTEAIKNQSLYQYGQTVLTAFQETEDALIRDIKQRERMEILKKQVELAEKTSRQLRLEFLNGLSPYLDVLLALDQEQQLRRDLIDAKAEQLEIRIALYRALSGGFETDQVAMP
ncbi:efflux transporter outer membrane subunit [Pricia sp. S334]|uniref:Efflux transporter outer membrane subunit n=1 Tax=Pricia mediterranea TaxID=3076079 RepID=A0ABU3L7X3_9FLAO|nr:efflux transporter outer membrane subunit [Pricia sp. S334]MDT7829850.1 efflux transporter outer membrane subunit [Pricia sp. S334]